MKSLMLIAAPVVFCFVSVNAQAAWWLVSVSGDKPNRTAVLVNKEDLSERANVLNLEKMSIDELAESSATKVFQGQTAVVEENSLLASTIYTNLYDCKQKAWRTIDRFEHPYNTDNYKRDRTQTAFAPVSGKNALERGMRRAHEFACNPASRTRENLMIPFSDEPIDPSADVWKNVWTDSVRPPFTTSKTMEEARAGLDAKLAEVKRMSAENLSRAEANMDKVLKDEGASRSKLNNCAQSRYRGADRMRDLCTLWYGRSEADLVSAWGLPAKSHEAGGVRFLKFFQGSTTQGINAYGAVVSSQDFTCDIDIEFRNGKFSSLKAWGNNCAEMKLPPPN